MMIRIRRRMRRRMKMIIRLRPGIIWSDVKRVKEMAAV